MFSSLGTKLVMKKMGLPKDALSFGSEQPAAGGKKASRDAAAAAELDDDAAAGGAWPKWMTVRNLPLTAQAWLSPVPPPVPVAPECPALGSPAPRDRDGKLVLGGGRRVLVVFLRCVGCAFAQKTFLALRQLSTTHQLKGLTCIAISHSSAAATQKWLDLIGGAWNVQVIVDEDRAIYAAWGLGLSSVWYYFNPATQTAAWREKGWLGARVATSIQRSGTAAPAPAPAATRPPPGKKGAAAAAPAAEEDDGFGPLSTMGNKWQQGGAFAVDEGGLVVWGGKAQSADEMMDLDAGCKALGCA